VIMEQSISFVLHAARQYVNALRSEARKASKQGMSHVSKDINDRADLIESAIRSVERNH